MPDPKLNRRVEYTRAALREALIDLCAVKPLTAIHVTDVCRQADINRSTFYLHYKDINELLRATENAIIEEMRQGIADTPLTSDDFVQRLNELKKDTRILHFMRTLISEQGDPHFMYAMQRLTYEAFQLHYASFPQADDRAKRLIYAFVVSGTAAALIAWMRGDAPELSAEQAVRTINALLLHGADAIAQP